jgi:glycosyltransferase involved in cell wall biosynthesis
MKILHVIANLAPRYGGPSKACWEMARAVAQLGHEVSIYTTNQDGPGELSVPVGQPVRQEGVEIRYFPIQAPRFWGTSLPLALGLRRKIPASDLVHIHSLYLFHNLVAGRYCRGYGIPYLMRPHGTLDPFIHRRHRWRKRLMERWFEHRNIRGAAALHFTTAAEAELAAPFTFETPGLVVPLGMDLDEFAGMPEPGSFRRRHPEIGDKPIILFFGRINFKKGLDILAKAFGAVARRRQDVHLVIAGPDNEGWGARVRTWLGAEGALGRTTFTGMLLGPDKLAVLRDASMFVLPSYSENFGLAVIEAMAAGLPVIISDQVNIWQEVETGGAGRVIPCDAAALAGQILELLADPGAAAGMGQKGRALVKERYPWPRIGRSLAEAYVRIIDEYRRNRERKPTQSRPQAAPNRS